MKKGKIKVRFKNKPELEEDAPSPDKLKQQELSSQDDSDEQEDPQAGLHRKLEETALALSGLMTKSYGKQWISVASKADLFFSKTTADAEFIHAPCIKGKTCLELSQLFPADVNMVTWSNLTPFQFCQWRILHYHPDNPHPASKKETPLTKAELSSPEESSPRMDPYGHMLSMIEENNKEYGESPVPGINIPSPASIHEQEDPIEEDENEDEDEDEDSLFLSPDEMIARQIIPAEEKTTPETDISPGAVSPEEPAKSREEEQDEDEDSLFLSPDEMIARQIIPAEEKTIRETDIGSGAVSLEEPAKSPEEEQDEDSLFLSPDEMINRIIGDGPSPQDSRPDTSAKPSSPEDRILERLMENLETPASTGDHQERLRASVEMVGEVSIQDLLDSPVDVEEESADLTDPDSITSSADLTDPDSITSSADFTDPDSITASAVQQEYSRIEDFTTPGGKLIPGDLDDDQPSEKEEFRQLEGLAPILKKGAIDSPDELISPDELAEEEEFVSQALPKGTVIAERYKIIRILSEKRDRNTYKVEDTRVENRTLILKEYIASHMDKEEYRTRRDAFRDTVRILSTFKHANLVLVYEAFTENYRDYFLMEVVEGLPITKLADMNTKPFSEKEVLNWGNQLCEATEFMHYRPTPFTLGDIKPWHIMVDGDGKVRITGYDLQRFFDTNRTLEFMPDDPTKLYDDVTKVARVLFFLLTKTHYSDNLMEIPWPANTRPKMKKLIEKACREGQRTYGDIREFKKDLQDTQVEDNVEVIRRRFIFPAHTLDFSWIRRGFEKVASQHPLLICLEILLIVFLAFILTAMRLEAVYARPDVPIYYVSTQEGLLIYNARNDELIRKMPDLDGVSFILPMTIRYRQPNREEPEAIRVLITGREKNRDLQVLRSQNLEELLSISAERHATQGILSPDGDFLYILHPSSDLISAVNIRELALSRVFPTGRNPGGLLYIDNRITDPVDTPPAPEEATDDGAIASPMETASSSRGTLVISNRDSNDIQFLNCENGMIENHVIIEGSPGAMVFVRRQGQIIFADTSFDRLGFIKPDNPYEAEYMDLPGKNPSSLAYDSRNNKLWIALKDSNGLALLDLDSNTFESFSSGGELSTPVGMTDTIKTGTGQSPRQIHLDENNQRLYVLNHESNNLTIINTENNQIIRRIDLDQTPGAFCLESLR